jgi:cytosine/adenosine deaminase-related metal-dependent hydrolase
MSPYQALWVASMGGAEFMGMTQVIGSIEAGKLADLIILNSNPLTDIRSTTDMQFVMKGGVLYEPDSLDEVWPRQKPFGAYPWLDPDAYLNDDRPTNYFDRGRAR